MCRVHSEVQIKDIARRFVKRPDAPGHLVAQLYCYRCGEELDGEQELREEPWGTASYATLECDNCGFYLLGRAALVEVEAAWQELWRT